jgi:two-component system response regulator
LTTNTSPFHLLLVEDNPDDVEMTLAAWETTAPEVTIHVAENGREAVEYLRPGNGNPPRPDLVLLDLNMPVMDGRAVLSELKNDPQLSDIPVLVLTTSTAPVDVRDAYRRHANCYLNKPADFDEFLALARAIEGFWLKLAVLPDGR